MKNNSSQSQQKKHLPEIDIMKNILFMVLGALSLGRGAKFALFEEVAW